MGSQLRPQGRPSGKDRLKDERTVTIAEFVSHFAAAAQLGLGRERRASVLPWPARNLELGVRARHKIFGATVLRSEA